MDCNKDWNIEFEIPELDVLFSSFCSLEKATTYLDLMSQLNFARLKLREIFEPHFPMLVNYIQRSAIIYTITNKLQANVDTEFKNKFNTLS